jgi:hypothetical protein
MLHQLLLVDRGDEVPCAGRHPRQDIDNLQACATADREVVCVGQCRLVPSEGIHVNKDAR